MGKKNRQEGDDGETEVLRITSMTKQPGSGSGRIKREDLIDDEHLGQVKSSKANSIQVTAVDLERLIEHAKKEGLEPVFFLNFRRKGPMLAPRIWAMVPIEKWMGIR